MLIRSLARSGAGLAGLGSMALRIAPQFWERYREDLGRSVEAAPLRPQPRLWPAFGLHAAWLGHSTVLLNLDGVTILTDPVFSRRVGLNVGPLTLGLKRLVEPALDRRDLPPIDLVLLSHAHMDHFDLPSLGALESPQTTVVTATGTSDLLRTGRYAAVHELNWGDTVQIGDLSLRAFEVRHWGARLRTDHFRGYNGYVIESPRYRVVFGGDTAYTNTFSALRSSRPTDLAIMPIGAYDPWITSHCNPEQALSMANDAGAEFVLPVHHQTFKLSREPRREPIERLLATAGRNPDRVVLQEIGAEWSFDAPR